MAWIKCSKCGAINTEFSEKCYSCGKRLDTSDGVIYSDNSGKEYNPLTPIENLMEGKRGC